MRKRYWAPLGLLLMVLVIATSSGAGPAATPDPTPQQTITKLRAQLRSARLANADLNDEIDTQDAVIGDQNDTIARLRARDPLDAVTARNPDGLWNAMRAIWTAFPTLDPGVLCGYDKSNVPDDGLGISVTSFTFYRWSTC